MRSVNMGVVTSAETDDNGPGGRLTALVVCVAAAITRI